MHPEYDTAVGAAAILADISSAAPGDGPRCAPRSHLRSDAARMDLTGQWELRWFPGTEALLAAGGDALAAPGAPAAQEPAEQEPAQDRSAGAWDAIDVPSHWVLAADDHRWGAPAYTNVVYPFPVDPPHVPMDSPAAVYRRRLDVPAGFVPEGGRAVLRTLGIESLGVVHLNGRRVGAIRGSRLTQELDVTDLLREGENTLAVRVHQFSAASYLEDQDQWWLPGIFREIELLARPASRIDDVWLRADYDPATGQGTLIPEVRAPEGAWPVTIRVPELGIEETLASPAELAPIEVGTVEPWSCDTPRLYEAQVASAGAVDGDGDGEGAGETVTLRLGFRRVEIVGHEWRVNGTKLRLRGVNRHEFHPAQGRVFDEQDAWEGLLLMKRHNVNAVRTSHYPPHPRLLEMTDELGLWVIDECDLETHGFELGGWRGNPADEPMWRDALLDRAERFVERDKNHPSVIAWSLGNESHTGRNTAAMAAWIHRRDPERPVHYEPDFDGRYTDIVSRMYEPLESMREMSAGIGQGRATTAGRNAVLAQRPMIQCEYAHAMGNGPGGLLEYEEAFSTLPQWHGGFIWEWRDHGLATRTADGTPFYGYGGDFGEELHDGSFVCDGLVLSDGTPSPALAELAAVIAPVRLDIVDAKDAEAKGQKGEGRALRVRNLRHSADTSDLRLVAVREADGRAVETLELDAPPIPAGDEALVNLPAALLDAGRGSGGHDDGAAREVWLTVRAELASDAAWAEAGHVVSSTQIRLAERTPVAPAAVGRDEIHDGAPSSNGLGAAAADEALAPVGPGTTGEVALGDARFDASTGLLTRIGALAVRGPRLSLWRSPTENDSLDGFGSYLDATPEETHGLGAPGPSTARTWNDRHLHLLKRRTVSVRWEAADRTAGAGHPASSLVVNERWSPASSRHSVDVTLRWSWTDQGLALEADASPSDGWDGTWGRLGLVLELEPGLEHVAWFGTGPEENYPDSRQAARVGRYERPLAQMVCPYAVPQESGHRAGLRETTLRGAAGDLTVTALPVAGELPGFSVRQHDEHEVAAAAHPHELPEPHAVHLFLDAAQHGLGSRSCGPDVLPAYQLRPRAGSWSLLLRVD